MQTKRRTALEALTVEQQAFLQNETATAPLSTPDHAEHQASRNRPPVIAVRQPHRQQNAVDSTPYSGQPPLAFHYHRGRGTHSLTVRLADRVARALRSASIQRSLDYQEPYTQQAIVEAALLDWLQRHQHLTQE